MKRGIARLRARAGAIARASSGSRLEIAASILAVLCWCGCSDQTSRAPQQKETPKSVKVGYIPFNNCLPFFLAQEKGFFAARGLRMSAVRFNDSTEALNALIAGQVDALAGITFSSYWAAEQEEPGRLKLFLQHYEKPENPFSYLLVSKGSDIKALPDLRGKKIGTYSGVSQLLYLRLFLKKVGLEPGKDVSVLQVGTDLQIQALGAGQYDALFTVEPYGTIAVLRGVARVLEASPRTKYIQNPFWGGAAAVTTKYLNDNRRTVVLLYEGMAEGVRSMRQNVVAAKEILPKYTPMEPEVAAKSGLYEWVLVDEKVPTEGIQSLADLMSAEGVLRKKVDAVAMLLKPEDLSAP
jgi:NitT/TauT family transport system substrate-binding protein